MTPPRDRRSVKRSTEADRLSPESIAYRGTHAALTPYDRKMVDLERVWGSIDRLLSFVSVDTARKFGTAMAKMNDAISAPAEDFDPVEVDRKIGVVMRGMDALVTEAVSAGHSPFDPAKTWTVPVDDVLFVVGRDIASAHMAATHIEQYADPDVPARKIRVWSIEELCRVARLFSPTTERIQELFPGAVPVRVEPPGTLKPEPKLSPFDPSKGDDLSDVLPLSSEVLAPAEEPSEFD